MNTRNIEVNNNIYELIKNYKDGYAESDFLAKCTDYFDDYDYIFGDYSYDSLRLKGFYEKNNKNVRNINNIEILDDYIKNFCSHECRWFLLKKQKK